MDWKKKQTSPRIWKMQGYVRCTQTRAGRHSASLGLIKEVHYGFESHEARDRKDKDTFAASKPKNQLYLIRTL